LYCVVFQRKFEAQKAAVVLFNFVLKKPAYDAMLNNTQQLQVLCLKNCTYIHVSQYTKLEFLLISI